MLPRKLSALLRLAVRDAKACEKAPNYRLTMGEWHKPDEDAKTCHVCMAGAVMANTLRVPWGQLAEPKGDDDTANALRAINELRSGFTEDAFAELTLGSEPTRRQRAALSMAGKEIEAHFDTYMTRRAPWLVYLKAAAILAKAGL